MLDALTLVEVVAQLYMLFGNESLGRLVEVGYGEFLSPQTGDKRRESLSLKCVLLKKPFDRASQSARRLTATYEITHHIR